MNNEKGPPFAGGPVKPGKLQATYGTVTEVANGDVWPPPPSIL